MGYVVWNVYGEWGYLGLDGLHGGIRHVPSLLLVGGQCCECDFYTCAGKPQTTPMSQNKNQDGFLSTWASIETTGCNVRIQNMVWHHVVVNDLSISNRGATQTLIFEVCVTS